MGIMHRVFTAACVLTVGASFAALAQAKELRLGGVHAPGSFETEALNDFAERVKSKSGDELTINIFPAGQLGDAVSQIENVLVGAQDMFANVADWNQHLVNDYGILGMPFAFSGIDHVKEFLSSDRYEQIKKRMVEEHGVRVLADNYYRLPRVLVTKEPVDGVEDLQGIKLRMANIDSYLKTWEALGANTTVIPWAESYLALRTGVVDGLDSPLSSVYPQKFYQAAPYITRTDHSVAPFNVLISEQVFQSLSPEHQQILEEAAREAGVGYTEAIQAEFDEHRRKMEAEGAVINDIDLAPFVERAADVAREFEEQGQWSEGLFDLVQGMRPS